MNIESLPAKIKSLWHRLLHRQQVDADLDEEIRSTLELVTKRKIDEGMSPKEAERIATIELGGVEQLKEQVRSVRAGAWLDTLLQDIRFAFRMLRKNLGFTLIVAITLSLGIATNVAIFSFVDTLLLRPGPGKNPAGLVRIKDEVSFPEYAYLKQHSRTLREIVADYSTAPLYVEINGESSEVQGAVVSSGYFQLLGLRSSLGRFFTPEEDAVPDRDAVAVISEALWQTDFDGEQDVLGKQLVINDRTFTIIGVMPADFQGVIVGGTPNEIWIPSEMIRVGYRWCDGFRPDCTPFSVMGRVAPGASVPQAQAEVNGLLHQFQQTIPGLDHRQVYVVTKESELAYGREYLILLLRLLSTTAGLLLLVVCANVGGLLLARSAARSSEIAMRLALGAKRTRILRQLGTESLLLAILAGGFGVLLSRWVVHFLINFGVNVDAEGYHRFLAVPVDANVLLYSVGVTALAGILFGLLPAWQASRTQLNDTLRGGGAAGARPGHTRAMMLALQISLSLSLMVAAGLLARSASHIEAGYNMDVHNVLGLRLRPKLLQYTPQKAQVFEHEVARRLRELPGVESVTLAKGIGFVWTGFGNARLAMPGKAYPRPDDEPVVGVKEIAPDYFATLKIPFIAGRDFRESDNQTSERVAIVNETLAERALQGALPLGRSVILDKVPYRIIGVVKDAELHNELQSETPVAYLSYWQNADEVDARMAIRVAGDPAAMLPEIRRTIAGVDPDVPITETMPLMDQVRGQFVEARIAGTALTAASALALLLCAMGLYGVVAYDVRRRTREIGVRMALGANTRDVVGLFIRQGFVLILVGGAVGLALSLAVTRLLAAYLFGVRPFDPASFSAATGVLFATALIACYVPARRAMRVDPMVALRHE